MKDSQIYSHTTLPQVASRQIARQYMQYHQEGRIICRGAWNDQRKQDSHTLLRRIVQIVIVLLGILVYASVEAGVVDVIFSDYDVRYTLYTLNDGQQEYVHLDKISQMFRLSFDIDPIDNRVVLKNDDKTASFFPGHETIIANRRSYFLEVPPRQIEGTIMVPLQFLTEILPLIYEGEILWDPDKRIFRIGLQDLEIYQLFASPYGDYTRLVVEMNQAAGYDVTEKLPSRLLVELPYAKLFIPQSAIEVNSRAVEYVKIINSFGSTQMTIKLGPDFEQYNHQVLEDPPRLVFDVYNTLDVPVATPPPEDTISEQGIVETNLLEEPELDATTPTLKPFSLQTVVLDPGHGGSDPGVTLASATEGQPAVWEKETTLQIAQMLANSLQQRFGRIRVVLTREGDSFIGAENRTTIANHNRADIFVSLHVNNSPVSTDSGFEVYVMDYGSLDLPNGYETLSAQSQLLDYAQARYIERSTRLAEAIIAAYNARYAGHSGSLKSAPLFTLKGATMPAVHIELGYSSNIDDRNSILLEEFQQLLVAAITDGVAAFNKAEEQRK